MSMQWYLAKKGQQYGPYTWEQMIQFAGEGRISPEDYVRHHQMNEWKPAAEIEGLIHRQASPIPPPASVGAASLGIRQPNVPVENAYAKEIRIAGALEYVGLGPRIIAQLIDGIIFIVAGGILMYMSYQRMITSYQAGIHPTFPWAAYLFLSVGSILYYVLMEGLVGATLGKMAMGIQVRKVDGSPCGLSASLVRNLLRIIDALPVFYLLGIILVINSPRKQRLGDRVADTVVIRKSSIN
ncbi:Uncharacterized membrane protein YckC, RDD family [Tindallia magadiensis]|uniref:Uncharacterized membrane protein YckC, RDD family n=1 Tax=Tindallia magadiensis TaxID=69895 RepID=A0A1I3E611_9FIRM|nr:RDD family protein [Tindallia magadiensis]SFH94427.1 Uncharacterized membrane protein YckC, RDD family [Tindallia magadiensis]